MAEWYTIDIEFTQKGNKPIAGRLEDLRKMLKEIDYDFPKLEIEGLKDAYWRSPLVEIEDIINLIHSNGFPCKGRMSRVPLDVIYHTSIYCNDCGNWTVSEKSQSLNRDGGTG